MIRKLADELFQKIIEMNSKESLDSIPHSDSFLKEMESYLSIPRHELKSVIQLLKESNKILSFEIIKEDKGKDIKKVEGYVETDLVTIRRLKNFFQKVLMDEYEKQNHSRMLVHQIIKDIYSRPAYYKNTPIGQVANKAIMLEEYEMLLQKEYTQFTDSMKAKKFNDLLEQTDVLLADKRIEEAKKQSKEEKESPEYQRAVDSEQYGDFSSSSKKMSISKVLQIYGIEFFFRVNLRKYNFDILTQVIDNGDIDRKSDLKLLKDMLQKVKSNTSRDTKLLDYIENIHKLERSITRHIVSGSVH
ncbi:MAG: hypothetical protein MUD12_04660 [Spirochaetes bacterium]|jgi:hypothetical protein|nr:hypothetical protein [Spirochaetota bacterium]